MQPTANIHVFKTNIQSEIDKVVISELLDSHHLIERWNLDLEDIDCVLRVVSGSIQPHEIIQMITNNGFQCQELD